MILMNIDYCHFDIFLWIVSGITSLVPCVIFVRYDRSDKVGSITLGKFIQIAIVGWSFFTVSFTAFSIAAIGLDSQKCNFSSNHPSLFIIGSGCLSIIVTLTFLATLFAQNISNMKKEQK